MLKKGKEGFYQVDRSLLIIIKTIAMRIRNYPVIFLLAFFSLYRCSDPSENDEEQMVFSYNEPGGISSLDPAFSRNVENIWAVHQLFNGLVRMNNDLKVTPDIAKDWELNEKGTVYTFHIRDSVLFHEHEAFPDRQARIVDAHDFEYSFERIMASETASPGSYIFDKLKDGKEKGIEALNDSTLRLRLEDPFPPFLGLLTMKYCSVVPREVVERIGKERFGRDPVGTGPFQVHKWEEGVKLIMARNPHYFETDQQGRSLPYLDGVEISFLKDRHTAFMEFTKGRFHYLSGVDGSFKEEVLNDAGQLRNKYQGDFRLKKGPYLKTDYLGILVDSNMKKVKDHPLSDPRVRRAMNHAIDRKEMVQHLRMGTGVPAHYGFIPHGLPSHGEKELGGLQFDRQKARRLMKEAGYPNGEGMPPIELSTTANYTDICEYVQNQLGKVGFQVEMNVLPPSNHRDNVAHSRLFFFRKSWVADYPDGQNFLSLFYSGNFSPKGPNYTHFSNARFDSLYEKAMKEKDPEKRRSLYRRMDRIVVEKAPVIPLFYDETLRLIRNNVKGLKENPMNLLDLRRVRIE